MGADSVGFQHLEQQRGNFVVNSAFIGDSAFLCTVTCGGVILVIDDDFFGVVRGENTLGFTLVQEILLFHYCGAFLECNLFISEIGFGGFAVIFDRFACGLVRDS